MQTDVKSRTLSATGAANVGGNRTRVKAIYFVNSATAGSVSFRDGGVSGTELINLVSPANTAGTGSTTVLIPGQGVLFQADPYVTLTNVTSVTFFYG